MTVRFYNTLTNKKDIFEPLAAGRVGLYTCGPTVYDYAHIGNFRAFVFEDLLRRFLVCSGYSVHHVMNLTDVDDKTIAGAQREKKNLCDYTAPYSQAFNEDLMALNCLAPSSQPRATGKIQLMLDLIQKLIDTGIAYENQGSVYYRVSKFKSYGKLSKKKLEMNITGASERVEADEYESKEEATDFVLWKAAKAGEAEIGAAWDSPWGKGRPGWHIECSAMSMKELGEQFDIHAGGEDLIFPHHENEIAQSEGATGKAPFVKYWLHCKFLLVDGEKMSKSKGNFYTFRDLLAKDCDPMALRYALLAVHYRSPLNFTLEGVKEAGEVIRKFDECYWLCLNRKTIRVHSPELGHMPVDITRILEGNKAEILEGLNDDLNVSLSLARLALTIKEINTHLAENRLGQGSLQSALEFFKWVDQLFGFNICGSEVIPKEILSLMEERSEVRKQVAADKGNKALWGASDQLRDQIQAQGWIVKDAKPGEPSTVKMKRRKWD